MFLAFFQRSPIGESSHFPPLSPTSLNRASLFSTLVVMSSISLPYRHHLAFTDSEIAFLCFYLLKRLPVFLHCLMNLSSLAFLRLLIPYLLFPSILASLSITSLPLNSVFLPYHINCIANISSQKTISTSAKRRLLTSPSVGPILSKYLPLFVL